MSKDGKDGKVTDISKLPRPAAGLGKVPLPATAMTTPEKLEKVGEGKEVEVVSESGESVAPTVYKPRRTSAKLQDHQKHYVAQAVASGLPVTEIAGMVRHTPKYIKQCIEEDPEIAEYVEHYSSTMMRARVEFQFAMLERQDAAWRALDDALIDKDIRVRMMAMDKVFAGCKLGATGESPVLEMNFTDPEAHRALTEATQGIHSLLKDIKAGVLVADPIGKHLHTTLPGPEDVIGHVPRRD